MPFIGEPPPDGEFAPRSVRDPRRLIYTDGVHLVVDGDAPADLLHQFARRVGLRPEWFQGDHYDLTTPLMAERVVASGATLVDMRDVARLRFPTGHAQRPEGWAPAVLGSGAPAARLARERHGDVMEFLQGPGERIWRGSNREANREAARRRAEEDRRRGYREAPSAPRRPRIVRLG